MATNFLYAAGVSGFIVTPFNLMTTELNALGAGATATSSVAGVSGRITQTNTGSAILGSIYFTSGGAFTPAAGANLAGWFLRTPDAVNYEKTVASTALSRAPDFTISLLATGYVSGDIAWANGGEVLLFAPNVKIFLLNNTVQLPTSGSTLKCGPIAIQY